MCVCVHCTFEPSVSEIALRIDEGNGLVRSPPNALRVGPASLLHEGKGKKELERRSSENVKCIPSCIGVKAQELSPVLLSPISTHPVDMNTHSVEKLVIEAESSELECCNEPPPHPP